MERNVVSPRSSYTIIQKLHNHRIPDKLNIAFTLKSPFAILTMGVDSCIRSFESVSIALSRRYLLCNITFGDLFQKGGIGLEEHDTVIASTSVKLILL